MTETVYLNGSFVPRKEAKVSAFDYGFLYGYGLFETMRAYNGIVFRLDTHISRIAGAAGILGIAVEADELKNAVTGIVEANGLKSARIRLTVSAGEGSMVPNPASCTAPTILVAATEYTPFSDDVYKKGYRLITSSIRRSSGSPLPAMKTLNYLEYLLARQEAKVSGYDEALLLNENGFITEASTSNLFLVKDGIIITPGLDNGILPGITRYVIAELTEQLGIQLMFAAITQETLDEADEVFISNSIMEIMPVTEIEDEPVNDGKPGPVTETLRTAYRDLVIQETNR